jgi:hypothetical protein
MNIYLHPSGVKKELKNDYIGEYKVFVPWSNTLLYLPMTDDLLDHSWKSVTVTNNGVSISSWTWYFNGSWYLSIPTADNILWNVFTISWYWKVSARPTYSAIFATRNSTSWWLTVQYEWTHLFASTATNNWDLIAVGNIFTKNNVWENYVLVRKVTNWELYKNWVKVWTATSWNWNIIQSWSASFIWRNGADSATNITWYIGQFIIENRAWTAQEVSDYYNQTKSNYWL